MNLRAAFRRALFVILALLLPAGGCAGRVLVEGRSELRSSQELKDEDRAAAVLHARRAASWYLPFAPHVGEAYRGLRELAILSEREGDRKTALSAWRSIRSASLSTRWLVEPHRRERLEADSAIARLASEEAPVSAMSKQRLSPRDAQELHRSALARDDAPKPGWVLALLLGLGAWASGMAWLFRRGLTQEGRIVKEVARRAGAMAIVGVVLFAAGVIWA